MQDKTSETAPSKATFNWEDPFLLDDQLTNEERIIRETARTYAEEKLLPRIIEAYLEEKTDRAIFNEMGALGLLGVTVPEQFGGAGASYVAYGLVAREIERVDSGYRSMNSVQ
jgi:glutaryl-CoA dehydrogenase